MISHDPISVSLREARGRVSEWMDHGSWEMDFVTGALHAICGYLEVVCSKSKGWDWEPLFVAKVVELGIRCAKNPSPIHCRFRHRLPHRKIDSPTLSNFSVSQSARRDR